MMKNKTEHEWLKEICDFIIYKSKFEYIKNTKENLYYNWEVWFVDYDKWTDKYRKIDVREIIFTSEFMDKFFNYKVANFWVMWWTKILLWLVEWNLDNPVQYLYNLLELWLKKD